MYTITEFFKKKDGAIIVLSTGRSFMAYKSSNDYKNIEHW